MLMIWIEALAFRGCELLSVAVVVREHLCKKLRRPAARPLPQTCPVWNDVVPAVVAPAGAGAEAVGSRGCGMSSPAMVHFGLYTCL